MGVIPEILLAINELTTDKLVFIVILACLYIVYTQTRS